MVTKHLSLICTALLALVTISFITPTTVDARPKHKTSRKHSRKAKKSKCSPAARAEGKRQAIWWMPPLFALWVNCHGGFVAGFGIFGMFVFVESITRMRERGKPDAILFYALGVSFLALLVNPYGYHLLTFLWLLVEKVP